MSALDTFRQHLAYKLVRRETRVELRELSKRQLDDVGLCRDDIDRASARAARRAVPLVRPSEIFVDASRGPIAVRA